VYASYPRADRRFLGGVIGLWAGSVYEASAVATLAARAGIDRVGAVHPASIGAAVLSFATILGGSFKAK
jgi:hypothetical protein